jgi:hypothetical protein
MKIQVRDGTASDVAETLHVFIFRVKQLKKKEWPLDPEIEDTMLLRNYFPVDTE